MTRSISNHDDVIDSRDVIERIEELEAERQGFLDEIEETSNKENLVVEDLEDAKADLANWDDDYGEELASLKDLAEEGENCSADWSYGSALIHENHWVEYVEELCKDIGDMPREIPHYIVIDWEATADNIAADYSQISFDGQTYYIRSC